MQGLLYDALVTERLADRNRRAAQHYHARSARRRRHVPVSRLMGALLFWHPRAG
ncbi:MAG: hypothetical protein ACRDI3_02485 [Actinomycetota bacterium]